MKQKINTFLVMAVSLLLFACQSNDPLDIPMNEEIVIDLATNTTRAADNSTESYVEHIDVFIFEAENDKPGKKAHYERQQLNNAPMLTLKALRSSFTVGTKYFVYLLANCNLSENTLGAMADYNALLNTKQEDPMLYITGLVINEADVPKYFLMDAVAKNNADQTAIELNNGKIADNTVLSATLRRAAAKVVVNITAGDEVEFKDLSGGNHTQGLGLYYVRNLSYDAFLLAEAKEDENIEAKVRTTSKGDTEYFNWDPETNPKTVSLVTYAYPNHWSNASTLEHETCIVMNLPMVYTSGGTTAEYPNSWYKIPMTDDQTLRRNNYYEVNISLNRPGATTESTPVDVEDIYYNVMDWTEQTIQVGNEDKPKYLMVNRNSMEMRNISQDATTLEFSSSSPVTITIKDVYYINKYGNKTSETPAINGTTVSGSIAGNITVNSPIPTNNTIRYFTLVITNQDGLSKEVQVEQYPLVYITNIQSSYSYRSDFITGGLGDGTNTAQDFLSNRSHYSFFAVDYDEKENKHIYSNARYNTSRKIIVAIDEAHVFIDPKQTVALDFMQQMAKRIRKYAGSQIVITQNIKDFTGSPEIARKSTAIINACQYSVIFALAPQDMNDLVILYEKAGKINEKEQDTITSNPRGRAFFMTSTYSRTNVDVLVNDRIRNLFEKLRDDAK